MRSKLGTYNNKITKRFLGVPLHFDACTHSNDSISSMQVWLFLIYIPVVHIRSTVCVPLIEVLRSICYVGW